MTKRPTVVIAGGGTAGHTNPGIAIAQALVKDGVPQNKILFIGGKRGNESTLVPAAGFELKTLSGRGVPRKISFAALKAAVQLVAGIFQGISVMIRLRPKVMCCLGGYAALPSTVGAVLTRTPIIVSEQNARASAVNKFAAKFAKNCALPFPDTDLPNGVLTGNPVLSAISSQTSKGRSDARKSLGIGNDKAMLVVWSGSLGASSVNSAVKGLAEMWADRDDVFIYHIVGNRYWDDFKDLDISDNYKAVAYENNMSDVLQAADVAICRSGASTIAELAIVGLPAVLVPLPNAPRDHQRANAAELAAVGGAIIVADQDLTALVLAETLDPLLTNSDKRLAMSVNAHSTARPDAAAAVARLMKEHIK